jgi:hypothetical protein
MTLEVAPRVLHRDAEVGLGKHQNAIEVKPSDTIVAVLDRIQKSSGGQFRAGQQRLFSQDVLTPELRFNRVNRFASQLEDVGLTVSDYGLQDGTVLDLMLLKPSGGMLVLVDKPADGVMDEPVLLACDFYPLDSIATVKKAITRRTAIKPGRQSLFYRSE